jgi:hypothetical protein
MIYIQVRRTLDWKDRAAVEKGLVAKFRPKAAMWDATFNMPYHLFRQRVKEIAELNLSRVENARVVTAHEPVPAEAMIAPVDDDDWFSPDLGNILGELTDPAIFGCHWIRHILEPERHRRRYKGLLKEAVTRKVILATNNYAFRNRPGIEILLRDHLSASLRLQSTPAEFRYLPLAMSIHNRSMASQTVLAIGRPTISRDELIEIYAQHRRLYARTFLSPSLRWAKPYVAMMSQLMDELKPV